ncbi:glycerate kinase [Halopenitus salinus]|uniref:Glycerate kinase n=1 Tax=Halopenitus salinus TaxID=1198295 RepID=A0ABD5UZG8_9EURY
MTVRNRATLVEGDEAVRRADAVGIIEEALAAVAPDRLLEGILERSGDVVTIDGRTYDLDAASDASADDVFVIGAGKGAGALASAVLGRLGDAVSEALIVEKDASTVDSTAFDLPEDAVSVMEAGHPIPNGASLAAGERVLALADRAGPDDLVVCCITGGASALLAAPDGIELDAMARTTDRLLRAGAPIEDVNAVRKHLSAIKGGGLADRLAPATVESLIVVDEVAGDPWGPTAPDATTYADALRVLDRYGLREAIPQTASGRLERGAKGDRPETLDAAAIADLPVRNVVLADASSVCLPAAEAARERGYEPIVLSTRIEGEASEVGLVHAGIATDAVESGRPAEPPMALVTGGETTVTVDGEGGEGGPNQETALGFARGVDGWSGIVGAFVGTDGTDGPTELAGAMATGETRRRASEAGVPISDALAANDAAGTVRELDDAIVTGPTDTNLMDLRIVLVGGDAPE